MEAGAEAHVGDSIGAPPCAVMMMWSRLSVGQYWICIPDAPLASLLGVDVLVF